MLWVVVHEGRKRLNLSEWGSYSPDEREGKLAEICEQIANGDMRGPKYLWLQRTASDAATARGRLPMDGRLAAILNR